MRSVMASRRNGCDRGDGALRVDLVERGTLWALMMRAEFAHVIAFHHGDLVLRRFDGVHRPEARRPRRRGRRARQDRPPRSAGARRRNVRICPRRAPASPSRATSPCSGRGRDVADAEPDAPVVRAVGPRVVDEWVWCSENWPAFTGMNAVCCGRHRPRAAGRATGGCRGSCISACGIARACANPARPPCSRPRPAHRSAPPRR